MSIGHVLLVAFIVLVPALAIVPVFLRLRARRRYAFFRVADEKTGAPLAGAEVLLLRGNTSTRGYVSNGAVVQGLLIEGGTKHIGNLDASGCYRGVFGANDSALQVRASGVSGVVGLESVSEYGQFPAEPYVCLVRMGTLAPPVKRSPLTYGLGPGESLQAREGYVSSYEAPEPAGDYLCWPTLELARTHDLSGGMSRFWRVRGVVTGPGTGGESFLLSVETSEPA